MVLNAAHRDAPIKPHCGSRRGEYDTGNTTNHQISLQPGGTLSQRNTQSRMHSDFCNTVNTAIIAIRLRPSWE